LRILEKRAEPCAAWLSGKRCGVAAKSGEGARVSRGEGIDVSGEVDRLCHAN
jgi:hypothetical protein